MHCCTLDSQRDVGDKLGWYRRSCSSVDDNFCFISNSYKHSFQQMLSGANKHTLGGGSKVSVNGCRAAKRAAWQQSPYDTRRWMTAYGDFRMND